MCAVFFFLLSLSVVESDHMDLKLLTKCSVALAEVPEAQDTRAPAFPAGSWLALEPGSSHTAPMYICWAGRWHLSWEGGCCLKGNEQRFAGQPRRRAGLATVGFYQGYKLHLWFHRHPINTQCFSFL